MRQNQWKVTLNINLRPPHACVHTHACIAHTYENRKKKMYHSQGITLLLLEPTVGIQFFFKFNKQGYIEHCLSKDEIIWLANFLCVYPEETSGYDQGCTIVFRVTWNSIKATRPKRTNRS